MKWSSEICVSDGLKWKTSTAAHTPAVCLRVCVCVSCRLWGSYVCICSVRRVLGGDHLHFHLLCLLEGPLQSQGRGHYGCEPLAARHCLAISVLALYSETSSESPIKTCASKHKQPRQETSGPVHQALLFLTWMIKPWKERGNIWTVWSFGLTNVFPYFLPRTEDKMQEATKQTSLYYGGRCDNKPRHLWLCPDWHGDE